MKVMSGLLALILLLAATVGVTPAISQVSDAARPAGSAPTFEYRLGSGDKIRVIVFGEENLSGEFAISGDGIISLPLVGEVRALGLTAVELQAVIVAAFKQGYLNDPKVSIEVLNFRPFYILGEVNRPGEYPYGNGMTVVNAVALAQGFTYRANQKKVYIRHANQDKEEAVPLTSSLMVAPGDTVRIAERYF